jgi:ribonuclease P protein component
MKTKFTKNSRLQNADQFDCVFKKGRRTTSPHFAIFYYSNNLSHPRLGIIAAKKNLAKAVTRNAFKRIVRESFRLLQNKLGNFDIIVFAYRGSAGLPKEELRKCLDKQLEKLTQRLP